MMERPAPAPTARRWLEILVSLATLVACLGMFVDLEWSVAHRDSEITTQGERIKALEDNQRAMTESLDGLKLAVNDAVNENKVTNAALDATNHTLQFTNEQLSQILMRGQPHGIAP